MYEKDGISRDEVEHIVNTFPNQGNYVPHFSEKEYINRYQWFLYPWLMSQFFVIVS